MVIALLIFILLAVGYISLILPRLICRADMSELDCDFAHRGLHGKELPENSLGAFRLAVEHRKGIELDVQLSSDGIPMVFHDESLLRVCGRNEKLCELTAAELSGIALCGNDKYTVPTLKQVLELVDGRVPLLIELKTGNAELCPVVAEMLDGYGGSFCIESFDPRLLAWMKKYRPQYARGQLVGRSVKEKHTESLVQNFILVSLISHLLSRPDFVAADVNMKGNLSFFLCRKLFGIPVYGWTVRDGETYKACKKKGMNTIFENFIP